MTAPFFADPDVTLYLGDARITENRLAQLSLLAEAAP